MAHKSKEEQRQYDATQRHKRYRRLHPNMDEDMVALRKEAHETGMFGENVALNTLEGSVLVGQPADLDWGGKNVEVKTALKRRPKLRSYATGEWFVGKTYFWKFQLKRQVHKADYFLLICCDENRNIEHMFLIPSSIVKVGQLNLAESRIDEYEEYRVPFDGLTTQVID